MRDVIDYEHGISAVDSGYQRPLLVAVHLIVEGGRAAIVDTAHNSSAERVLAALADKGIGPGQVDYVVLTHVHLDHAGAAGLLMRECPNARLTVHPRGARHMIDPSRLVAATFEVYGEAKARRTYGDIVPVPAGRVIETPEGSSIELNGRRLRFIDTPGHARHHVCVVDEASGHVFAGDTFGVAYREADCGGRRFAFASTTPVQFDPPRLHDSVDRLLALRPEAIYLTHFGQVRDVEFMGESLHRSIEAHARIATDCRDAGPARRERIVEGLRRAMIDEARRCGSTREDSELLAAYDHDIGLNADGLLAWLDSGPS